MHNSFFASLSLMEMNHILYFFSLLCIRWQLSLPPLQTSANQVAHVQSSKALGMCPHLFFFTPQIFLKSNPAVFELGSRCFLSREWRECVTVPAVMLQRSPGSFPCRHRVWQQPWPLPTSCGAPAETRRSIWGWRRLVRAQRPQSRFIRCFWRRWRGAGTKPLWSSKKTARRHLSPGGSTMSSVVQRPKASWRSVTGFR